MRGWFAAGIAGAVSSVVVLATVWVLQQGSHTSGSGGIPAGQFGNASRFEQKSPESGSDTASLDGYRRHTAMPEIGEFSDAPKLENRRGSPSGSIPVRSASFTSTIASAAEPNTIAAVLPSAEFVWYSDANPREKIKLTWPEDGLAIVSLRKNESLKPGGEGNGWGTDSGDLNLKAVELAGSAVADFVSSVNPDKHTRIGVPGLYYVQGNGWSKPQLILVVADKLPEQFFPLTVEADDTRFSNVNEKLLSSNLSYADELAERLKDSLSWTLQDGIRDKEPSSVDRVGGYAVTVTNRNVYRTTWSGVVSTPMPLEFVDRVKVTLKDSDKHRPTVISVLGRIEPPPKESNYYWEFQKHDLVGDNETHPLPGIEIGFRIQIGKGADVNSDIQVRNGTSGSFTNLSRASGDIDFYTHTLAGTAELSQLTVRDVKSSEEAEWQPKVNVSLKNRRPGIVSSAIDSDSPTDFPSDFSVQKKEGMSLTLAGTNSAEGRLWLYVLQKYTDPSAVNRPDAGSPVIYRTVRAPILVGSTSTWKQKVDVPQPSGEQRLCLMCVTELADGRVAVSDPRYLDVNYKAYLAPRIVSVTPLSGGSPASGNVVGGGDLSLQISAENLSPGDQIVVREVDQQLGTAHEVTAENVGGRPFTVVVPNPGSGSHKLTVRVKRGDSLSESRDVLLTVEDQGPYFDSVLPSDFGIAANVTELVIRFQSVAPLADSVEPAAFTVRGNRGSGDSLKVESAKIVGARAVKLTFTDPVPLSVYQLTIDGSKGGLKDQLGNTFDANGTAAGGDGETFLKVLEPTLIRENVAGAGLQLDISDLITQRVGINSTAEQFVEYPEYVSRKQPQAGFNPSDKVVTRVARLYYYRDAHRVAQIINRRAESLNSAEATKSRQLADRARLRAEQLTDQRKENERAAVTSALIARSAENEIERYTSGLEQHRRDAESADRALERAQGFLTQEMEKDAEQRDAASVQRLEREIADHSRRSADARAQVGLFETLLQKSRDAVKTLQAQERELREKWNQSEAVEDRAVANQFRLDVQATGTDPDTYVKGNKDSEDPVAQVTITVIGEGLLQLRGPLKGVNIVQTMINEIDSPVGQVRVGVHTVQINGEDGGKMEEVAARMQQYIDQSRFLTRQSGQLLRQAIATVASRKLMESDHSGLGSPLSQSELKHYGDRAIPESDIELRRFQDAFFGAEFLAQLREMNSEFIHGENKLLSLHPMDTTSLVNALSILALASNDTRHEILCAFEALATGKLPLDEMQFLEQSGVRRGFFVRDYELLASKSRFVSLRGHFDGHVQGDNTLNAPQRDFLKLAQILKSRLVAERELKQRVVERALIEVRQREVENQQEQLRVAEQNARTSLDTQRGEFKEKIVFASKAQQSLIKKIDDVFIGIDKQISGQLAENQVMEFQKWSDKNVEGYIKRIGGTEHTGARVDREGRGSNNATGSPKSKATGLLLLSLGIPVFDATETWLENLSPDTMRSLQVLKKELDKGIADALRVGDVEGMHDLVRRVGKSAFDQFFNDPTIKSIANSDRREESLVVLKTLRDLGTVGVPVEIRGTSGELLRLQLIPPYQFSEIDMPSGLFAINLDDTVSWQSELRRWDSELREFLSKWDSDGAEAFRGEVELHEAVTAARELLEKPREDTEPQKEWFLQPDADLTLFIQWKRIRILQAESLKRMTMSRRDLLLAASGKVMSDIRDAGRAMLENRHVEVSLMLRRAAVTWGRATVEYQRQAGLYNRDSGYLDIESEDVSNELLQFQEALAALLQGDLEYQFAVQAVDALRAPLDHKKLLDMLVDEAEEKYIQLLEGTRAHTAVMDGYIKSLATALDDDFRTQFYDPAFRRVREAAYSCGTVELGQIATETVLANNRDFAVVKPQATMEFNLPQRRIAIVEAMDLAKAGVADYGALLADPNFLALTKLYSGGSTAQTFGSDSENSSVRSVLPGLGSQSADEAMAQSATGRSDSGSQLESLVPDPAIYKFETGTGFEIRPVIQPDGQSVVFDFDYMYTTNIREPVRADEKHLGRVKRHFVHTDVQLGNYELREVSRYRVALKAERSGRGVPLLEDIPIIGALGRPMNDGQSSLQQNIILADSVIYPTLFDLMGLRWAPAVADLQIEELLEQEFVYGNRMKFLRQHVDSVSGTNVDSFLQIPEGARRSDLYFPQSRIRTDHPTGHEGRSNLNHDSRLIEGMPQSSAAEGSSRIAPVVPQSGLETPIFQTPPAVSSGAALNNVPEIPTTPPSAIRASETPGEPVSATGLQGADVRYISRRQLAAGRETFSLDSAPIRQRVRSDATVVPAAAGNNVIGRATIGELQPSAVLRGSTPTSEGTEKARRWKLPGWLPGSKP